MRNLKRKRRCARKFLGLYFFDYPPDLSIPLSPVAASNCAAECALAVQAIDTGFVVLRDQSRASGPMRIPTAKSENAANHADALIGPPATSNATPVPQAPSADVAKPIVEWSAIVAPLFSGIALWLMPAVKEPLSPGTVNP